MRKKIFFLASSLDARCWLSKSSDPFPCSKQYYMLCVPPISFHIKILLYQHGRSALDTSRTLFPFSIDSRCLLYSYMWVIVCTFMCIYLFSCLSVPAPYLLILHCEYLVWCIVVVYQS
jgi:hypothetical protein